MSNDIYLNGDILYPYKVKIHKYIKMEAENVFSTVRAQLLSQLGQHIAGRVTVSLEEYPQWLRCSIQERVNMVLCEDDTILACDDDHRILSLTDSIVTRGYLGLAPITETGCYCSALLSRIHHELRQAQVTDSKLHAHVKLGSFLTPAETVVSGIKMSMPSTVVDFIEEQDDVLGSYYSMDITIDFFDIMKLAELRQRWV